MQEVDSLFSILVLSFSDSALIGLGEIKDFDTNTYVEDLERAKYNIDILEMLQQKTLGNLRVEEQTMLKEILLDLRAKYVDGIRQKKIPNI